MDNPAQIEVAWRVGILNKTRAGNAWQIFRKHQGLGTLDVGIETPSD
jgi:hypothetical protein